MTVAFCQFELHKIIFNKHYYNFNQYSGHDIIFNKLYLKGYMYMEIDCGYTVCKFQHAEKAVFDNMGPVGLAVMATGFYHLLACQASDVCSENC